MSGQINEAEVARIAKGLTKAQREAIVGATDLMSSHGGYPFFAAKVTQVPWPEGVATFLTLSADRLTRLGLAVRAHLIAREEG